MLISYCIIVMKNLQEVKMIQTSVTNDNSHQPQLAECQEECKNVYFYLWTKALF